MRFGRPREEHEGDVRPPMSGGVQRFSDDGGSASSNGDGAAGEGNPSRNLSFPVLGKSQISLGNLSPTVTPPISGTVVEIKKTADLQEQRKGFVGNVFQYGNLAINDEGQPRVSEVSHCKVKGKEKRVNKGTETGKRKDGNGLEAHNDKLHSGSSTESDPDPPRKLQKAQYVGSWDSKQGKMIYHLLGEGGTVLKLEKDTVLELIHLM